MGDVMITAQNGFCIFMCNERLFDYCVTIKPYVDLDTVVFISNDFFAVWDYVEKCNPSLLLKRRNKKKGRQQLAKSRRSYDLTSF